MTRDVTMPQEMGAELLEGFEIAPYRWNLLTDEMTWGCPAGGFLRSTGLAGLCTGKALAALREDGARRREWASQAAEGARNRFIFALPEGGGRTAWIEDQLHRTTIAGVPHVIGLMRRIAAPSRGGLAMPADQGREGRRRLLSHLVDAGPEHERAYLLFGIDNLRDLNRALGPDVTDDVIEEVDLRIASACPPRGVYARVGSAKFALAVIGLGTQELARLAREVMARVGRTEIHSPAGPLAVSVSAGICHIPRGMRLPADPLANAQAAHDEARIGRVEGLRFARLGDGQVNLRDRYMTGARMVMDAIADGRLTVAFQPVVLAERPGSIAFHECLARIIDPAGKPVPAGLFMPAIEHLGLVRQVDREVLRLALRALARNPAHRLSVNLSPQSMNDGEWLSILEEGVARCPDAGDRLILEITESSAMLDPARTLGFMNRVRRLGCALALDDFGAGYTSFKHFRDFRFDAVKIDGSFINGIAGNEDNKILLRTLVSIARHFSMFTVAEFVEQEEDAAYLRAMGVNCLQGYLYGAPSFHPEWLEETVETALRA